MVIIAINIILRLATREMETSKYYFHHYPQQSAYNLRTDVQNKAFWQVNLMLLLAILSKAVTK